MPRLPVTRKADRESKRPHACYARRRVSRGYVLSIVALLGCTSSPPGQMRDASVGRDAGMVCEPAWVFCDDFEDGETGGWTAAGDVAVIPSTDGPSTSNLRARVDEIGTPAVLTTSVPRIADRFVRFWLRLPVDAPATRFRLLELGEPGTEYANWLGVLRGSDGVWQPEFGQSLPTGGGGGPGAASSIPGGVWMCVEVSIASRDIGTGTLGSLITARFATARGATITEGGVGTAAVEMASHTSLRFGVLALHPTEGLDPIVGPLDVELDDLAIDDVPIVCEP